MAVPVDHASVRVAAPAHEGEQQARDAGLHEHEGVPEERPVHRLQRLEREVHVAQVRRGRSHPELLAHSLGPLDREVQQDAHLRLLLRVQIALSLGEEGPGEEAPHVAGGDEAKVRVQEPSLEELGRLADVCGDFHRMQHAPHKLFPVHLVLGRHSQRIQAPLEDVAAKPEEQLQRQPDHQANGVPWHDRNFHHLSRVIHSDRERGVSAAGRLEFCVCGPLTADAQPPTRRLCAFLGFETQERFRADSLALPQVHGSVWGRQTAFRCGRYERRRALWRD
mmetsp:Transcript_2999/g.12122  ORF Transcript_2999/g.12122 Transcript_2999/m.12122 type:complete len:279 (+) Transcript_2999:1117-1953(+)